MDRDSIRKKVALRMARRLVVVIAPALREEEVQDALIEFLSVIEDEMLRFEAKVGEFVRPEPGVN
jgi:hypothetical protein